MKATIFARLTALAASTAVTFSIVAMVTHYGQLHDSGIPLLALASTTAAD